MGMAALNKRLAALVRPDVAEADTEGDADAAVSTYFSPTAGTA